MPTVASTILMSLAASAGGTSTHGQELGLLQAMQGRAILDSETLTRTSDAIKQMALRQKQNLAPLTQEQKSLLDNFKTALQEFWTGDNGLKARVDTLNAELRTTKADGITTCDTELEASFDSDVGHLQGLRNTVKDKYDAWLLVRNRQGLADQAVTNFKNTVSVDACHEAPSATFFSTLSATVAQKKQEWSDLGTALSNANGDLTGASGEITGAQGDYEHQACTLKTNAVATCNAYAVCRKRAETAFSEHSTMITELSEVVRNEALVIKKSLCYVDLLISHVADDQNQRATEITIGNCDTLQLTTEENDQLILDTGVVPAELKSCAGYAAATADGLECQRDDAAMSEFPSWEGCRDCNPDTRNGVGEDGSITLADVVLPVANVVVPPAQQPVVD